ncbi:hypothetical protein OIDMADRAFT_36308 [Oidiodendron maius Zn]|uniref:Uncharacterized protein n=1 Tax=Oidiodendron maius (strain Zn) TaxID=913774 RepID=A0A0C3CT03_OIDMZ|nr:hypothetical protein OIDMADRAFT_36308 [Oidiodendron maius Zn]
MAQPNKVTYPLPANSEINISCEANAAYLQRVTVTIPGDATSPYSFEGVGEPGDMTLVNRVDAIELASSDTERPAIFTFEFDSSGTGTQFQPSPTVLQPYVKATPWGSLITIASEDGVDADNNDSIVFINTAIIAQLDGAAKASGMWERGEEKGVRKLKV